MEIPVHELYTIEGKAGPAFERVKEAMHWLLSPDSGNIGEKLLRDAHAVHGKPVRIAVRTTTEMGFTTLEGHPTIITNPNFLKHMKLAHPNGVLHAMSEERMLAHELVHAGQRKATPEIEAKLDEFMLNASMKANAHLTPDQLFQQSVPLIKAMGETHYEPAMQHIVQYVDSVGLQTNEATLAHLHNDPEFIAYTKEFEEPAMEMENKVAALRGEPLIAKYNVGHIIPADLKRRAMIDQLSEAYGLHQKPRLETPFAAKKPISSWQEYVKNPAELRLSKWQKPEHEHPFIAKHEDGGRT